MSAEKFFDALNETIANTETSFVNVISSIAPWLAPLAPAYMTYQHMINFLDFDVWLAWALSALVEILGFSTVSTFLDFWFYNRRVSAKSKQAPLGVVIVSFLFYLGLVIGSNVVIDIAKSFGTEYWQDWSIIFVRFLLTLQTIPAALIVAVRTGHRELLREIKKEKTERDLAKVSESFTKVSESSTNDNEGSPKDWRKLRPRLSDNDLVTLANASPEVIKRLSEQHNVTSRTVENWRSYAQKELDSD